MAELNQTQVMAFRDKYRLGIKSWYNPWLHVAIVFGTGLSVIGYSLSQVANSQPYEWLTLLITLLLVNFAEYAAHRWLGHKKTRLGKLFYQRHSGDHHTFFINRLLPYESVRDWRVVFFPAYLIFAFLLGLVVPGYFLLSYLLSENIAWIYAATAIFSYLFYEFMHFSYHLKSGSIVEKIPGWRTLRHLHEVHHEREEMHIHNFNITLPIFDILLGTQCTLKQKNNKKNK